MKTIVLDMDDVLVDLLSSWVNFLNTKFNLSVSTNEIVDWKITTAFPTLNYNEIFEPLYLDYFWSCVTPIPDAVKYVKELKNHYKILIATASDFRTVPPKLKNCLLKFFPFIEEKDIIITFHKDLINCDFIVDDYDENIKNSLATRILFTKPYNFNSDSSNFDLRVSNWKELFEFFMKKQ